MAVKEWKDKAKPVLRPKDWMTGWCQRCNKHFEKELGVCPDCLLRSNYYNKTRVEKAVDDYNEWKKDHGIPI
jgi:predicted amidophosphoribosyltransferase